ncbi:MAG: DUF6265 family protein [Proteobacteria bacterium]|nr:DUF6265 family protein [Pseudomonadota bacterium]MDA0914540.1 DUF6265 family protein [Pseudomonadota bacterium]MDA1033719.1 DUF6265 family protein [Pseudomonadota bacterium]
MKLSKRMMLVMAATLSAAPVASEEPQMETRIGEKGFVSPPATIGQLDWLVGQWAGEGIQGAPAMESWLPAIGGTMVGTFVQETPEGTIMLSEHMYIVPREGSLALKLRHFIADLTGGKEKDEMLTFRLVAIEDCAAYFNALTLRCANPDNPGAGLVSAVRMQSGGELSFRFDRIAGPGELSIERCSQAVSTVKINECFAATLRRADGQRAKYLAAAIGRVTDEPALAAKIKASDATFVAYRESECDAVYENWKGGTIRGMMALSCKIAMTERRTQIIWQNWLTYMDGAAPILPEPRLTR